MRKGWHSRPQEHSQASPGCPEGRRRGFQLPFTAAGGNSDGDLFLREKTLTLNRSTLALEYYGPAHTDSDISVAIPEADILHCGDTYWNGIYPFIDYSTGGNIDGMIKAAEANVAAVTDKTIVIPGHGNPVSNKAELSAYRDILVAIRENVAKLKREGRSLDETIAAKPTTARSLTVNRLRLPLALRHSPACTNAIVLMCRERSGGDAQREAMARCLELRKTRRPNVNANRWSSGGRQR
jgi:glyoxylase-like metal-dependent hydrolase (beta-lactamase superfamily II)